MKLKSLLNETPRIAVSFRDKISLSEIRKVKESGVDIAELRIDLFSSFQKKHVLKEIQKFKDFPTIATIRSNKEGGSWDLSEKERLALFMAVIPEVDGVDIELSSTAILKEVVRKAQLAKKLVLISYHNFSKTPGLEQLNRLARQAKTHGADIVKIACFAAGGQDLRTLALFTLSNSSKNMITIAMGAKGIASRILFPDLGSLITYAYLGKSTAPGQLDYKTTAKLFELFYRPSRQRN